MINNLQALMFIFISILFLAANSFSDSRIFSTDSSCSFNIPKGWQDVQDPNQSNNFGSYSVIFNFASSKDGPDDKFQETIMIERHHFDSTISMDYFIQGIRAHNISYLREFRTLEKGETELDSLPAKWALSSHKRFRPYCLNVLQFFVLKDGIGYYIVCSSVCEQYKENEEKFRSIIATIKFE